MAAIGMMIGGAIVNAPAFTGGNYLFSLLGRSDEAEKERKRHDLVIEAPSALSPSTNTSAGCG